MNKYLVLAEIKGVTEKWYLVRAMSINGAREKIKFYTEHSIGVLYYMPIEGSEVDNSFDFWETDVMPLDQLQYGENNE